MSKSKRSFVYRWLRSAVVGVCLALLPMTVYAEARQINWWHAMGGVLGERVADIAKGYNATQDKCEVLATVGRGICLVSCLFECC